MMIFQLLKLVIEIIKLLMKTEEEADNERQSVLNGWLAIRTPNDGTSSHRIVFSGARGVQQKLDWVDHKIEELKSEVDAYVYQWENGSKTRVIKNSANFKNFETNWGMLKVVGPKNYKQEILDKNTKFVMYRIHSTTGATSISDELNNIKYIGDRKRKKLYIATIELRLTEASNYDYFLVKKTEKIRFNDIYYLQRQQVLNDEKACMAIVFENINIIHLKTVKFQFKTKSKQNRNR